MNAASVRTPEAAVAAANPWREALYRLRAEPLPIYLFDDATLPAASLWAGARLLLREGRIGDDPQRPLVLGGAPSPSWLVAAVAALFSGRPLCAAATPSAARFAGLPPGCCAAAGDDGAVVVMPWSELLQAGRSPAPASIRLPTGDWHEPAHFSVVLRSLLVPTHVLCMSATA